MKELHSKPICIKRLVTRTLINTWVSSKRGSVGLLHHVLSAYLCCETSMPIFQTAFNNVKIQLQTASLHSVADVMNIG